MDRFKKLSKYLSSPYPILDNYSSVSLPLFSKKKTKDHFLCGFLFGYLRELIATENSSPLKTFLTHYEHVLLPTFLKSENSFPEKRVTDSLKLLRGIVAKIGKSSPEKTLQDLESIKEKTKELAFIVRVQLFSFMSRLAEKAPSNEKAAKKDLRKKMKLLLKDEEIPFEAVYFFFLSTAFKVNVRLYDEEQPTVEAMSFNFDSKASPTLAFLKDEVGRLRLLIREDVEFGDHRKALQAAQSREMLFQRDLAKSEDRLVDSQMKYNKLLRAYRNSVQVNSLLLDGMEDLVTALETLKKNPEVSQKLKLPGKAVLNKKFNAMLKSENDLKLMHYNYDKEKEDLVSNCKDQMNELANRIKQVFPQGEEEDPNDDESLISLEKDTAIGDEDRVLIEKKLKGSNNIKFLHAYIAENRIIDERRNKLIEKIDDDESNENEKNSSVGDKRSAFDEIFPAEEPKREFECPICCDVVTMDEVFLFECGHKFCNECVKNSLLAKYDNGQWGFEIQCFAGECSFTMNAFNSLPILKALIGKERVDAMSEKAARNITTNSCAKCGYGFIADDNPDNQIKNVQCPDCGEWTCVKCGQLKHEEKICKKVWQEMAVALNNDRLRCCPNCMEIYLKDEHCEHVKCHKCGTEFCYNCSAPREPILGHGGHYHRRGCKYFFRMMDPKTKTEVLEDPIEPKCAGCKRNNQACKRPEMDLKSYYEKLGLKLENEENPYDN